MKCIIAIALCGLVAIGALAATNEVKVAWDPNPESFCNGYLILYGSRSQSYQITNVVQGRLNTTLVVSNMPPGVSYFVAQATADNGLVSGYSNEVLWTNGVPTVPVLPPVLSPPRNLQLKATIQSRFGTNSPWEDLAWIRTSAPATNVYRAVLVTETER